MAGQRRAAPGSTPKKLVPPRPPIGPVAPPPKGMRAVRVAKPAKTDGKPTRKTGRASTSLARVESKAVARVDVDEDLEHARGLAESSLATNTRRAYRADIADWKTYATSVGTPVVPAEPAAVAAYIANMDHKRHLARATIRRRCAAIAHLHREKQAPNPISDPGVQKVLQGVNRTRTEEQRKKHPLTPEILRQVLAHRRTSIRDRAMLLLGIVLGVRRSELVALRWIDVTEHDEGLLVRIATSKTDQKGKGRIITAPRHEDATVCPVRAFEAWKRISKDKHRVFPVSAQTVADRVKRAAVLAGADPSLFAGHSLRAGMMTIASDSGVPLAVAMGQSGHRSHDQAAGYVRKRTAFSNATPRAVLDAIARAPETAKKKKGRA